MDSVDRLRLALVGAGRRGCGAHLPVIAALQDAFELVAICDRDPEVAQRVAAQYGARAFTHVAEMVESVQIDVADVTVPADAHHPVACFLAAHGIHLLVETPIAVTRRTAAMMIEAATRHNVVLEVAENPYRAPVERLKQAAIRAGTIGEVSRIYHVFREGGYHGMSSVRIKAGADPVALFGNRHVTPVTEIVDRAHRRHTEERWDLSLIDFANGVQALMIYSNLVHARALGRGQGAISQIDGTEGTIVGDRLCIVPPERRDRGAQAIEYEPQRREEVQGGVRVLREIFYELPGGTIRWENPLAKYPLTESQIPVADELMAVYAAVVDGRPLEYGAESGYLDQALNLAAEESARRQREVLRFPLPDRFACEEQIEARYYEQYGHTVDEIEALLDVHFPRI